MTSAKRSSISQIKSSYDEPYMKRHAISTQTPHQLTPQYSSRPGDCKHVDVNTTDLAACWRGFDVNRLYATNCYEVVMEVTGEHQQPSPRKTHHMRKKMYGAQYCISCIKQFTLFSILSAAQFLPMLSTVLVQGAKSTDRMTSPVAVHPCHRGRSPKHAHRANIYSNYIHQRPACFFSVACLRDLHD